jgi:heme A synthase
VTSHIAVHFAHRVGALMVTLAVASTAARVLRAGRDPWLRRPALLAVGLVVLQVSLGALTIWSHRAVVPTTTHLVVGAGLLATCLVLTLRAGRVAAVGTAVPAEMGLPRRALA